MICPTNHHSDYESICLPACSAGASSIIATGDFWREQCLPGIITFYGLLEKFLDLPFINRNIPNLNVCFWCGSRRLFTSADCSTKILCSFRISVRQCKILEDFLDWVIISLSEFWSFHDVRMWFFFCCFDFLKKTLEIMWKVCSLISRFKIFFWSSKYFLFKNMEL